MRRRLAQEGAPGRAEHLLAAAAGVSSVTNLAALAGAGRQVPLNGLLLAILILGALGGQAAMYVDGLILSLLGGAFRGRGSARDVRVVFAWANVPRLLDLALWLLLFGAFGAGIFATPFRVEALLRAGFGRVLLWVPAVALTFWLYALWTIGLSVAHEYSWVEALLTLLLARVLVGGVAVTVFLIVPVASFWAGLL